LQQRAPQEEAWLSELARGDLEALGMIYDAYATMLYGYARSLGATQSVAEDVLQEVFLRLARRPATLSGVKNLRAYLFASVRREVFRWTRRLSPRKEARMADPDPVFESTDPDLAVEEMRHVEEALSRLPTPQREVVVMKVYGLLTFDEIARVTRVSPNTAASRYRYAIDKLKRMLRDPR
jgi:RNA polymerase sigma-70 factor (ECF subfamily)